MEGIDDPELAKGIILRDENGTYVLCAVDWCLIVNEAYDSFRRKIAAAAGTTPSHVALQTVHQHDALICDIAAQRQLDKIEKGPPHLDLEWFDRVTSNVADEVREAKSHFRRVTQIGTSQVKVDRIASNRRVKGPDGSILVRWSATKDAAVRDAPEGLIDPWLKTISLCDGDKPMVQLHYYATHPQSYYGEGRATWDVPGIARERLERETGVFQVYFTGCAGNVTMGKYNDGAHERRQELAGRMYDAMKKSASEMKLQPAEPVRWKTLDVRFPPFQGGRLDEKADRKIIADPKASVQGRLNAALALAWLERIKSGRGIELSAMSIGSVCILHLPGEPFIEFQLAAQNQRPDCFVAVAGYGEGGAGYICVESAYAEGGYEPTDSNVAPESEQILKDAMAELLKE